jgi:hypothetical protein
MALVDPGCSADGGDVRELVRQATRLVCAETAASGGYVLLKNPSLCLAGTSVLVADLFLWFGIHRLRKTEKSFADLI